MSDHEEAHDRAAAMSEVEALELAIVALRSHEREAKSDIVSLLERGAHASYIEPTRVSLAKYRAALLRLEVMWGMKLEEDNA